MLTNLFWTTLRAAIFSATNKTVFPWYSAFAIIFVIVCDFPVPGGPWSTKLFPFAAAAIATICDESALTGIAISFILNSSSKLSADISLSSCCQFIAPLIKLDTTLFSSNSLERLWISFHITNWPKENKPTKAISSIFQRFLPIIACLIVLKIKGISTPCSSSGNGSRPLMLILWSCRKYSSKVILTCVSSCLLRIT